MDRTDPPQPDPQTTRLLKAILDGDPEASEQLMPLVYNELHRMAERMLGGERVGHTLQPTALINEAWLRLVPQQSGWENRNHFVRVAAKAMRRVLVDHARARERQKRGGGAHQVTFDSQLLGDDAGPDELLAVDEALSKLHEVDDKLAQIVELRVFGGMKHSEIANATGTSLRSVERGWRLARAWLIQAMGME